MAPKTTNYTAIQQDEIEVLRSIYMEDFVEGETKTGAWNKVTDRNFKIMMKGIIRGNQKIAVALFVSFPSTYPKTIPNLHVVFDDEVPRPTRVQILEIISIEPRRHVGTEMIFEITSSLQEILDQIPNVDPKDVPTLDEERMLREQIAMAKAQAEEEEQRVKAEATNDAEVEKQLTRLRAQEKERANKWRSRKFSSAADEMANLEPIPGVIRFDQLDKDGDHYRKELDVAAVHEKVKFCDGTLGPIYTVQLWNASTPEKNNLKSESRQAPSLVLKECFISTTEDDEDRKTALMAVEADLRLTIRRSTPHPNVIIPINYTITKSSCSLPTDISGWKVNILMPLAAKGSISDVLDVAGQLDIKRVRSWSYQILEGLHFYHRNHLAHGRLHLNNVLLQQSEAKIIVAMLADSGYMHKLHALSGNVVSRLPIKWKAPEEGKGGDTSLQTDIWYFGICLLQMGFGKDVINKHTSPKGLLQDLRLSTSFEAVIRQVFSRTPTKRPSAWKLLHFEFFRNDESLLRRSDSDLEFPSMETSSSQPLRSRHQSTTMTNTSRYEKEFAEDGRLGRGGFGEVFKARNRIDGQVYAVKKIKAKSKSALDLVLSEVSVLSRLNHPNVVRYYASWIEESLLKPAMAKPSSSFDISPTSLSKLLGGPFMSPGLRASLPPTYSPGREILSIMKF